MSAALPSKNTDLCLEQRSPTGGGGVVPEVLAEQLPGDTGKDGGTNQDYDAAQINKMHCIAPSQEMQNQDVIFNIWWWLIR